jgi:2-dehydropantoate 2-reductase
MAEDLERGRMPEIDWLNGEIVSLGRTVKVNTPVNEQLVLLVKAAFAEKKSPQMSGKELLK